MYENSETSPGFALRMTRVLALAAMAEEIGEGDDEHGAEAQHDGGGVGLDILAFFQGVEDI